MIPKSWKSIILILPRQRTGSENERVLMHITVRAIFLPSNLCMGYNNPALWTCMLSHTSPEYWNGIYVFWKGLVFHFSPSKN